MSQKQAFLALGALGVVFGDIGTSPLYAFRVALDAAGGVAPHIIMGILSMIFWSLILVVTIKYVALILRADNGGEGGILALAALMDLHKNSINRRSKTLLMVGIIGGALLFGDAVITPAISVLSAIEGLHDVAPAFIGLSVPITVFILMILFIAQRFGIMRIAGLFGPIMLVWFITLAAAGTNAVAANPAILSALSPHHAVMLASSEPTLILAILGSVFLAVTGGEALYADLGQFGRTAISRAWLFVALPALVLNYFGQGALLLVNPSEDIANTFYSLFSKDLLLPIIALSTLSTIIASQAVVTGLFSLGRQAVELGFLPPMLVRNMTPHNAHDVYIPVVNFFVGTLSIIVVLVFQTSDQLADAYGISVAGAMVTTTILYVALLMKRVPKFINARLWIIVILSPVLLLDLAFVAASANKLLNGGILPISLGAVVVVIVLAWRKGRARMVEMHNSGADKTNSISGYISADAATKNVGVFLTRPGQKSPIALQELSKLAGCSFSKIIVLSVFTTSKPRVDAKSCVTFVKFSENSARININVGYMQPVNVPSLIGPTLEKLGVTSRNVTYIANLDRPISPRHIRSFDDIFFAIFTFLARLALRSTDRFHLPKTRTLEVGMPRQL